MDGIRKSAGTWRLGMPQNRVNWRVGGVLCPEMDVAEVMVMMVLRILGQWPLKHSVVHTSLLRAGRKQVFFLGSFIAFIFCGALDWTLERLGKVETRH